MTKKLIFDIETTGLNSMIDRITCISILNVEDNTISSFYEEDESQILKKFWSLIKYTDTLIGFNSTSFDFTFLIHRSLINSVKICSNFNILKKIDLRQVVNSFFINYDKKIRGTLNDWSKILGLGEKETNGLECVDAYNRKDWKFITEHCESDCKITLALLNRCKECNLI